VIPRSEWAARVEEMEKTKSRLSDMAYLAGLKCKDQNGTNYCWINGPAYAMEMLRVAQGLPVVYLSPASVGCKIKNFRNSGGWAGEGMEYVIENGIVPENLWPPNAQRRQYDKGESWEEAKKYICPEWWDIEGHNFDLLFTLLLYRVPVPVGYNWWGHVVCAIDPVVTGRNDYGIRIRNSWGMDWGTDGYSVLNERKGGAYDSGIAPRTAIPSLG